ncbi:MAG: hypothetical protein US86_C0007G0098 [Candidatus Daviesbacteria bacterium GW2011_GWA2_38_24]|uniref:Uncharacterized protein n=1 Tax=Candidatus Daviesbacteria bacterium GW2011_GWA2_38_24 TaxID=1618422 RepID=A0A0G0JEF0_9BACT|nr:MAG: hypothetical protein US86_C0007G0098 [Candidatus Daviesbacteria bacterium GW2011_GWA2_38_24]KKQ78780.1 MAG: hypothetical protein UT01_C0060G0014 [Candidatus Daviesbacteria bacterium GW2011_GWA1_38_7]OGE22705.1 MAG: hypothetical protein A2688_02860 [Candidatus Daviesbacteria bacterium RIFCSPHIGHO2_01_FULL_38_8]
MKIRLLLHVSSFFLVGLLISSQISSVKAQTNIPLTQDCENGRVIIRIDIPPFNSLTDNPFDYIQITRGRKRNIGPISFTQPVNLPKVINNQQMIDKYLDSNADYIYTIKAIKENPLFKMPGLPSINLQNNEYKIEEISVKTISCNTNQSTSQNDQGQVFTEITNFFTQTIPSVASSIFSKSSENGSTENNSTIIGGRSAVKIENTNKGAKQERVNQPISGDSFCVGLSEGDCRQNNNCSYDEFSKFCKRKEEKQPDSNIPFCIGLTPDKCRENSNCVLDKTTNFCKSKDDKDQATSTTPLPDPSGFPLRGKLAKIPTTTSLTFPFIDKKENQFSLRSDEFAQNGITVNGCTKPESKNNTEITVLTLSYKTYNINGYPLESNIKYIPNCEENGLIGLTDIEDINEVGTIEFTASFVTDPTSTYDSSQSKNIGVAILHQNPSQATVTIRRDRETTNVAIKLLPPQPENEPVTITATTNTKISNPVFELVESSQKTRVSSVQITDNCQNGQGDCVYQIKTRIGKLQEVNFFDGDNKLKTEQIVYSDRTDYGDGEVIGEKPAERGIDHIIGVYLQLPDGEVELPRDGSDIEFPIGDGETTIQVKIIYDQPDDDGKYEKYKYFKIRYQPRTEEKPREDGAVPAEQQAECDPTGEVDSNIWTYAGEKCDKEHPGTKAQVWRCGETEKLASGYPTDDPDCQGEPECGEFQAIRNECTSCGFARVIGQNNCGQTKAIEENKADPGCKTIQYCTSEEEKKETIEYQTGACDDVYYPEEGNGGTGCTHKYSKDPYPGCYYVFDVNAPRYACGLE